MAICPFAVQKLLPQNSRTGRAITPRSVALHTTTSGDVEPYKFFASPGAQGVESHFWVGNGGEIHQYMDTGVKADCQYDGNAYAISIETADNGAPNPDNLSAWTPAAMASLTKLVAWICKTHSIPAQKCPTWDGHGIGYHAQFTSNPGWNHPDNPHACPGSHKIAQVPTVIANVKAALAPPPPPPKPPVFKFIPYWLSLLLEARKKDIHAPRTVCTHKATTLGVERALVTWGYPAHLLLVDGHYGTSTDAAVRWFQTKVSGTKNPDGILGPLEWARLAGGPAGKRLFVPMSGNYKRWIA